MEGVKLSQCDFVAVEYGIFAERCLQLNVINSHINARCHSNSCVARQYLLLDDTAHFWQLQAFGRCCRHASELPQLGLVDDVRLHMIRFATASGRSEEANGAARATRFSDT